MEGTLERTALALASEVGFTKIVQVVSVDNLNKTGNSIEWFQLL